MLVTFRSSAYADITMFGEIALQLLKLMGHSGTVPGALMPEDIGPALEQLEAGLARLEENARQDTPQEADEDDEPRVSLSHRALPLVNLLKASRDAEKPVMWDK